MQAMIELRPDTIPGAPEGSLDEVVARNVSVHLEMESDNALMLIIEDEDLHVHLKVTHKGRSPLRTWVYESYRKDDPK